MPTTVQTVLREIGIARREQLVALRDQPDGPMRVEHINTEAELVDVVRLDGRSGARVYPGDLERWISEDEADEPAALGARAYWPWQRRSP